jgi:calcineurin-like phosphoesterase family protein
MQYDRNEGSPIVILPDIQILCCNALEYVYNIIRERKLPMSKIWLTADTHFGHANIIKYENRPFRESENGTTDLMDRELISRWNNAVGKNDRVFHLGDVGICGKEKMTEIVSSLNGRKTLIMGNHDKGKTAAWWRDVGFDEVSEYPIIIEEFIVLQHEPPTYYNDATPFFFVFGHVHGTELYGTVTKSAACVCVERWGYAPVLLSKIRDSALRLQNNV